MKLIKLIFVFFLATSNTVTAFLNVERLAPIFENFIKKKADLIVESEWTLKKLLEIFEKENYLKVKIKLYCAAHKSQEFIK